jgi:hypothetical protein
MKIRLAMLACLWLSAWPLQAIDCKISETRPLAGHPVEITALHPSDPSFTRLAEIAQTRLILMEPGLCRHRTLEGWYYGRVFVIRSFSSRFTYGDIIEIDAGRLR